MTITTKTISVSDMMNSETASISADGTIVAYGNSAGGAYVYRTATGTSTAVAGSAIASEPDLSADGSELVYPGATALERQNLATGVQQAIDPDAESGQISDDGAVVAFDRTVKGVSVATFDRFDAAGNQAFGQFASDGTDAERVDAISGSGQFVAFEAAASNGAPFGVASGDVTEVYLSDTTSGATPALVSVNSAGQFANADASGASVSETGGQIAFASKATNLAFDASGNPLTTGKQLDVYLRDTATNTTTLISKGPGGTPATAAGNDAPVISADGKYVLYDDSDTDRLTADTPTNPNGTSVYVYNVETGTTTLVSRDAAGNPIGGFADNGGGSFSADDTKTVFEEEPAGAANYSVVLATASGPVPTVAVSAVAGDGEVDAAEAGAGVAVTGTTTGAVGDTVTLFLDGRNATTGSAVGTATVKADGSFSAALSSATLEALAEGGHTLLATVQGDPATSYLSGDTTAAFTVDRTAPTASSPSLTVAPGAAATPIGIAAPSDNQTPTDGLAIVAGSLPTDGTVTLADGTTPVTAGESLTAAQLQGLAFTPTPGASSQSSAFTYAVTDAAGNTAQGSATLAVGPSGPGQPSGGPPGGGSTGASVTLNPAVAYAGGGAFVISGTVANVPGATSVDITASVDGTATTLGTASVRANGTFDFNDFVGAHSQGFITATATDATGHAVSGEADYALTAGLQGRYKAEQDRYTADGATVTATDRFKQDGSQDARLFAPGQTFTSSVFDTFHNGGAPESTFVFEPYRGLETITQFRVDGSDHDTISLASSDFSSVAEVLQNTHRTRGGGSLIVDPTTGDTIKLTGVTKAQLTANPGDVTFHA